MLPQLFRTKSVDAILHVVRCFEDENVVHVDGSVDPAGMSCSSCSECGTLGCVDGTCASCQSDFDCCLGYICIGGQCVPGV